MLVSVQQISHGTPSCAQILSELDALPPTALRRPGAGNDKARAVEVDGVAFGQQLRYFFDAAAGEVGAGRGGAGIALEAAPEFGDGDLQLDDQSVALGHLPAGGELEGAGTKGDDGVIAGAQFLHYARFVFAKGRVADLAPVVGQGLAVDILFDTAIDVEVGHVELLRQ